MVSLDIVFTTGQGLFISSMFIADNELMVAPVGSLYRKDHREDQTFFFLWLKNKRITGKLYNVFLKNIFNDIWQIKYLDANCWHIVQCTHAVTILDTTSALAYIVPHNLHKYRSIVECVTVKVSQVPLMKF